MKGRELLAMYAVVFGELALLAFYYAELHWLIPSVIPLVVLITYSGESE